MNSKDLEIEIYSFMARVGLYIQMEYGDEYYKTYCERDNLQTIHDFVGSYYFTGQNVPNTARYAMELIKCNFFKV